MELWKYLLIFSIIIFEICKTEIGHVEEIILSSKPVPVSFGTPDAFIRFQPWNFEKYPKFEIQFHTREPNGILLFVTTSRLSEEYIGLEIFNSNLYGFAQFLGKLFQIQLNPVDTSVSTGTFNKVSIQLLPTNNIVMQLDNFKTSKQIPTSGKLEFDSYTYIGGIDNVFRLPWIVYSQTGFAGCISYIRVNDDQFIDITQHLKVKGMPNIYSGVCHTSKASCFPDTCGTGKCYERTYNLLDSSKNFYCDCSGTNKSYSLAALNILRGESCIIESTKFVCNSKSYLLYTLDNERVSHIDEISLDFKTSSVKEPLFLMKAGSGGTNTSFISAEVIAGQVILIMKFKEIDDPKYLNVFFSKKSNLNDGQWHTLKIQIYGENMEMHIDDKIWKIKDILYRSSNAETFYFRVKEIYLGSVTRPPGVDKCTGELRNFFWNEENLIGLKEKHATYDSRMIIDRLILPVFPMFPRQPPAPCSVKPNHEYSILTSVPLNMNNGMVMIEFKTKFDGIIWHASTYYPFQNSMTLLLFSNSIVFVYKLQQLQGIVSRDLTSNSILLRDNAWHRVIIELNKLKNTILIYVDNVESIIAELRLPDNIRPLEFINSLVFNFGGISDKTFYQEFLSIIKEKSQEMAKWFVNENDFKFVGCFGEFLTNNDNFSTNYLLRSDMSTIPSNSLICRACQEDLVKCPKDYCQNGGKCYNINDKTIGCNCEKTSFFGQYCESRKPICYPTSCRNGGLCQIIENNKICNCTGTGFEGLECEISRCSNYNCFNGGICKIRLGFPECDCSMTMYEGIYCEKSKCPANFCLNNGRCLIDRSNQALYCICNGTGFTGSKCEQPICTPNECSGNGNCLVRGDKPVCDCKNEFEGKRCERLICPQDRCLNGGTCSVINKTWRCFCTNEFQGPRCEDRKNCPPSYCWNGGECKVINGFPQCDCSKVSFFGSQCENPINCPENFCSNGGRCYITGTNYVCNCSNTEYRGIRCTEKVVCPSGYCRNGGICKYIGDKFTCDCSVTPYAGEFCHEKSDGLLCDYKNSGFLINIFKKPFLSNGCVTSLVFQTWVKSGFIFGYETVDEKYWSIKLINGRPVVDINGMPFSMRTTVNDGKFHLLRVSHETSDFRVSVNHPPTETLVIPLEITPLSKMPIIHSKIIFGNSLPETLNENRFQGTIGNVHFQNCPIISLSTAGESVMIGGIYKQLIPMDPLPPIPEIIPCTADFCKNNGICSIRNYMPWCDCMNTGYTGENCEQRSYVVRSMPPKFGYVKTNVQPQVATNMDTMSFFAQLSESSSSLVTWVAKNGNYLEVKAKDGLLYLATNGMSSKPLNTKQLEKNVPHYFRLVNLLGRVTLFVNGTRIGHTKLQDPMLNKNLSIDISHVIVGANKNGDQSTKGVLGDFKHNKFKLFLPNGTLDPSVTTIPTLKLEQFLRRKKTKLGSFPKNNGTHGGIVFGQSMHVNPEGFGAGGIIFVSGGPTVLGAQLFGMGKMPINPLIFGLVLALFLFLMAFIWALMNLLRGTTFKILSKGVSLKGNPANLFSSKLISSKGVFGKNSFKKLEQTNTSVLKSGFDSRDALIESQETKLLSSQKSNNDSIPIVSTNISTKYQAVNLDSERFQPLSYGNGYIQLETEENKFEYQNNLFDEEGIRQSCCVLSNDNKYAITGSISGPPQLWDLNDGSLVHIVDGLNQACSSLHLALNNSILIGLVSQNVNNVHFKNLMMWSFPQGKIIEYETGTQCTTCCVSMDGMKVIMADHVTNPLITILDLTNFERRKLFYNKPENMSTDGIQILKATNNFQYVVAGYQSVDNISGYIVFDLHRRSAKETGIFQIKSILNAFDLINNNEAISGSENGELIVWSLESLSAIRQIKIREDNQSNIPHDGFINSLKISRSGFLLATSGADTRVKVWSMEDESLIYDLDKHTDEVYSLTFSNDNEILVTGSVDGSIRIWNMESGQEMCCFSSNIEINKVLISEDKTKIVGLGVRAGISKLVMLRMLRNAYHTKRIYSVDEELDN